MPRSMGFLGNLFGGEASSQKSIDKLVIKVKERYAQPEYRREAMEKLLALGTPEAIAGVLQRFAVVAQSPHWDEEEKRWLVEELAERGDPARAALLAFLKRADHIAFAAKALKRLSAGDAFMRDLADALRARPPEDHRTSQGKAELIAALGDANTADALAAVLPYLSDHADDVQCTTVDSIERLWSAPDAPHADSVTRLQAIVTDDARSARVLRHAAGAMMRLAIVIDPTKPLASAVAEDFVVKDGRLARS